jgi:hypothetical protein
MTSYVIAEVNRDPKKRSQPFTPRDFMPYAPQEVESVASKIKRSMAKLPKKKG